MILILSGCSKSTEPVETHRDQLVIAKIQVPTAQNPYGSPEFLISGENMNQFFETRPFPQTIDLDLGPSESRTLKTYSLVTGNHGENGRDSVLRMPRGWTLSGSNDGATWTELDRQDDSRPWKPDEERFYKLKSPAQYTHFRFVFTQSGPVALLRLYRLHLYAD